MFRRLLLEDSAVLFTITAFVTAFTIYVTIAWRAVRMKRPQVERFAQLPFATATPSARDDTGVSFAPTGRDLTAQGNALGFPPAETPAP